MRLILKRRPVFGKLFNSLGPYLEKCGLRGDQFGKLFNLWVPIYRADDTLRLLTLSSATQSEIRSQVKEWMWIQA